MGKQMGISWTDSTFSPWWGGANIFPGCKHCYADTLARRLQAMGVTGYATGVALTLLPDRLAEPLKRRKPTVYVVNFISDRFDEAVPTEYRRRVRSVIIDRGAPS